MLDEKKRRNSRNKILTKTLNDTKEAKMASSTLHRRASFNKPRPPRPISKIPDLNPITPIKVKRSKSMAKYNSGDDMKVNRQLNENTTKTFKVNSAPSDLLNNNIKVKGLDLVRNSDLVETPQTPDRGKENLVNRFYKASKGNNHISDITGFNLDDSPTKHVKKDTTEKNLPPIRKEENSEKNVAQAQKNLPTKSISDIPGLSNLINEKLKMLALERNRSTPSETTPSATSTPALSQRTSYLPTRNQSESQTPCEGANKLSVNEVLDETFRRLSKKGLLSNPNAPKRSDMRKTDTQRSKTDSSSSNDSTNLNSPNAPTPTRPISNIPGLNPNTQIGDNRMKLGVGNNKLCNNDRKLIQRNEEIPVIDQLIEKRNTTTGIKKLTRPELVPVDQKAKIYFLINHNEGKISHVIKSLKTNFPKQGKKQ